MDSALCYPPSKSQCSSGPCDFLEPYTCGACGIQFQFYNNLLEHMQSHAGESTIQVHVKLGRETNTTCEHTLSGCNACERQCDAT